jgi:2',3'-cyclic-nucleotide 2'-phosphodiesterase (5'-nucleotidase family)
MAAVLPDWGVTIFGIRHSLNPGPFNKKEHMFIVLFAGSAVGVNITSQVIWTQVLEQYFNQPFARSFGYQVLIALSTQLLGYGLAGMALPE